MKILLTGRTGLAGNAIYSRLKDNFENVYGLSSTDLDLRNRDKVFSFMSDMKPGIVVNAAAIVGGILANQSSPVKFLSDNLQIQTNLLDAAHSIGVDKLIFLGSSCIYPRISPQPISEEQILHGALEKTNEAYAVAKIAGIKLLEAYNQEYGHSWISLMPSSLYGPFDTFDMRNGHVIPSLFAKIEKARMNGTEFVELWGTGLPLREFLHSRDLATAVHLAIKSESEYQMLNVGSGVNISVRDLAHLIAQIIGYEGDIIFNPNYPDGTFEKLMDSSKMRRLGWRPEIALEDGLRETYKWYTKNHGLRKKDNR